MHFLPAAVQKNGDAAPDSITEVAERFILQAKSHYDLIVMDLPPIGPVSDVHELAHLLDRILLVVESGRCTHEALAAALANSGAVRKKLVGAVLNKADQPSLSKYADAGNGVAISEYAGFINDQQTPPAPPIARAAPREMPRPASPTAASDHDDQFAQPRRANASAKEGASPNA
jgi:hypothetical protein